MQHILYITRTTEGFPLLLTELQASEKLENPTSNLGTEDTRFFMKTKTCYSLWGVFLIKGFYFAYS